MKKLVFLSIIIIIAITALSSCNKSSAKTPTDKPSWETEKLSNYQLVRPLDYRKGASDGYGLPLQSNQWYLINKSSGCYLLPVYIGSSPSFVENAVRWNKIALMDTMQASLMSNGKAFEALRGVHTMEVVCFQDNWSVEPSMSPTGQLVVMAKKTE